MLKNYFINLTLVLTLLFNVAQAQTGDFYKEAWKRVDSLVKNRKPRSVYAEAHKIYKQARKDKNHLERIRALSVKADYAKIAHKRGESDFIISLEREILGLPFQYTAIMHSFIADTYLKYYKRNRYKINRIEVGTYNDPNLGFNQDHSIVEGKPVKPRKKIDIEKWDKDDFIDIIDYHFVHSLMGNKEYRKLKLEDYSRIFTFFNKEKKDESLYELLARNAIEFYFLDSWILGNKAIYIENPDFFKPARDFVKMDIKKFRKDKLKYRGLLAFKKLTNYVLKTRSKEALVRTQLYRYNKIRSKYQGKNEFLHYTNALKYLEKNYENKEVSGVLYNHAHVLYRNSNNIMGCKGEEKEYNYRKKALSLCEKCINKYKSTNAAKECHNLKKYLLAKYVDIKVEKIVPSNKVFPLLVTYRNTPTLWVRVWKPSKEIDLDRYYYRREKDLFKGAKLISTQKFLVKGGKDLNEHSTELLIKGLDLGKYIIEVSAEEKHPSEKYSVGIIQVSNLQSMHIVRESKAQIMVMDRSTGKALPGVGLKYYKRHWSKGKYKYTYLGEKTSDRYGMIIIEDENNDSSFKLHIRSKNLSYKLFKGKDTLDVGRIRIPYQPDKISEKHNINIFTDRKIYRPGDKIYFKALVYKGKDRNYSVEVNKKVTIVFRDANDQKIAEKEFTSNDFGSLSGSFDIPTNMLTGNCVIKAVADGLSGLRVEEHGYHRIRVEEYKAPKFEVKTKKADKEYKFNEDVKVEAQAVTFNGVAVSDAKFEYKVYRNRYDIWRPWYWGVGMDDPIDTGKGSTDKEGKINFSFTAKPFPGEHEDASVSYRYEIAVTDINGETQTVSSDVKVSSQSLFLSSNLQDLLSTEDLKKGIVFFSKNINGIHIPAEIKVELIKLKGPDMALTQRLWEKPTCPLYNKEEWNKLYPGHVYAKENELENYKQLETIASYSINNANDKKLIVPKREIPETGTYLLKAVSKDKDGKEVVYTKAFALFSTKGNKNPDKKVLWSACSHTKAYVGETVEYTFGSSRNITVMYELYVNGKHQYSKKLLLNNEKKTVKIPIKEEYRGKTILKIYTNNDNRAYVQESKIEVPFDNKKLNLHVASFRDKLLPGEKEKWTVTVKDWKNKAVGAEMLATLYDASLDKLKANKWNMLIYGASSYVRGWDINSPRTEHGRFIDLKKEELYRNIRTLSNDFFWKRSMEEKFYIRGYNSASYATLKKGNTEFRLADKDLSEVLVTGYQAGGEVELEDELEIADVEYDGAEEEIIPITRQILSSKLSTMAPHVKVRENFSKTAFFYPFLRTNEKGELKITFTVPESLTKWKLMGLAHTKDLTFGTITKYLVTKKDLMVNTNAPRFLREGDKIVFTTKLSNLSETDLSGGVKLELQNAETGATLAIIEDEAVKEFKVASKENSMVSWTIDIPSNLNLLKYTITASNGDYSDAESSLIPVLSKRIMVTKSMPFSVKNAGQSTLIVPDLKNILKKKTVEPYKMTMEFASNPIWYAVQALPYLMEYPYECSEQTFSRYFANKLASHIVNSNHKIKEIYYVWKSKAGTSKESLMSRLNKNKELKNILLQETPWVSEARTQEERMKRLGMLFDLNNMSREESRTIRKLEENQNYDGGWPWFKDMRSNRFITQHILSGLGYLTKITGKASHDRMINKALNWSKKEFIESYKKRKEKKTLGKGLNFIDLHYLYMTSFYKNVKYTQEEQLIVKYYLNKCMKYWKDASLYNKGLAALVLYRNGYESQAKDIVASLKEYSSTDSYYGMYWKENIGGMYAHKAQIETHSLMIEVFSEITDDKQSVSDMKIWLLNHKRTNSWESTKATVCAVYSLLSGRDDSFDMDPELKVSVGRKQIFDASKPENLIEAGTGYVKKVYGKEEISKDMDNITVSKSTDKLMWGALYLQYFDDIDKVWESSNGLKIEKLIFVERIVDGKLKKEIVKPGTLLNVGDKLKVVLSISNDYPMEYVHIKDLRASSLEPGFVKSGHRYNNGLGYYLSVKDASVNYFVDYLPKGKFNLSYNLRVTHKGKYSNGISTIQCMYAPEFQANSKGETIEIK